MNILTLLYLIIKQRKGSDTSAESGSEVEDVASPIAPKNIVTNPLLTPVHEESKFAAHASTSATRPTIEESIPVVDKVVDDGWGSPRASPTASSSGLLHSYFFVQLSKVTIPFLGLVQNLLLQHQQSLLSQASFGRLWVSFPL
jgi:hypothetical protein